MNFYEARMQKSFLYRCRYQIWFISLGLFISWVSLVYFYHSVSADNKNKVSLLYGGFENPIPSRDLDAKVAGNSGDKKEFIVENGGQSQSEIFSHGEKIKEVGFIEEDRIPSKEQPDEENSVSAGNSNPGKEGSIEDEGQSNSDLASNENGAKPINPLPSVENRIPDEEVTPIEENRNHSASVGNSNPGKKISTEKEGKSNSNIDLASNENGVELLNPLPIVENKTSRENSVKVADGILVKTKGKPNEQLTSNENRGESIKPLPNIESKTIETSDNQPEAENFSGVESVKPLPDSRNNTSKASYKYDREISSDNKSKDSCSGRYIYVHDLPRKFNDELLENCKNLSLWDSDYCPVVSNMGLGPPLNNSEGVFSNTGWFITNQFNLEIIFHYRMKQYECLTNDSSLASAIYVPYYAGVDVGRYLWDNMEKKDEGSIELVRWLRGRPEWQTMMGKDHFLVAGKTSWDFRRPTHDMAEWGNRLMLLPEVKNMTVLIIEPSPWDFNEYGVPYPTYFHPSRNVEVLEWQSRMRTHKRSFLFTFVGGPRPDMPKSGRLEIMNQCRAARKSCALLDCSGKGKKCYNPAIVMKLFQKSVFCLQPMGDTYTRRSAFDSILAGCIPVFFHPGSAYIHYLWHLPRHYNRYSVYIPSEDVKKGKANIEKILKQIPDKKVKEMREEVLKLIPRIMYANPMKKIETIKDAFDISVRNVLKRVKRLRRENREGKDPTSNIYPEYAWKYKMLGNVKKHQWDHLVNWAKY